MKCFIEPNIIFLIENQIKIIYNKAILKPIFITVSVSSVKISLPERNAPEAPRLNNRVGVK